MRRTGPSAPSDRLLTPAFLLVAFANLGYFTGIGAMLPVLPRYVEGPLAGTPATVGLVVGAFGFTAVLLRPVAGRLSDRRGRRLLLVAGGVIVTASVAGYTVVDAVWTLVALRLLTGAGEAMFFVGAATVVNDIAPDARRGEALSIFTLSLYGGLAIGPVIGERVLETVSFDAVWLVAAGSALVGAVLGSFVRETRPQETIDAPPTTRIVHPDGVLPGFILLTSVLGQVAFHAFVALHALEIGLAGASSAFVVFAAVMMTVRGVGARLPDRIGLLRSAAIALIASAAGLVVIAAVPTLAGLLAGSAIFSFGQALAFPALMAVAVSNAPLTERGSVVGTFTAFVDLAFGVGGAALGAVALVGGYRGAFLAAAGIGLLGLVLLRRLHRRTAVPVA